jgi:hypothetical protein
VAAGAMLDVVTSSTYWRILRSPILRVQKIALQRLGLLLATRCPLEAGRQRVMLRGGVKPAQLPSVVDPFVGEDAAKPNPLCDREEEETMPPTEASQGRR